MSSPSSTTNGFGDFAKLENDVRAYADPVLHGIPYTVKAVSGQPVPDIVRRVENDGDDLIVMATHGLRGWRRAILGPVTEGVVHRGEFPVLAVRQTFVTIRRIDPLAVLRSGEDREHHGA